MTDTTDTLATSATRRNTTRAQPRQVFARSELTALEEAFAAAYVRLNGDRYGALTAAGYAVRNKESMRSAANKLLARLCVRSAIVEAGGCHLLPPGHVVMLRPHLASRDEVLAMLTKLARSDDAPPDVRLRAAELLALHHGLVPGPSTPTREPGQLEVNATATPVSTPAAPPAPPGSGPRTLAEPRTLALALDLDPAGIERAGG